MTGLEKPAVWMKDPFKSGVIVIHADLRLIATNSFRTKRSLRFPRIDCIRQGTACISCYMTHLLPATHVKRERKRSREKRKERLLLSLRITYSYAPSASGSGDAQHLAGHCISCI